MLAREPTERANSYDFVKDLILKRYRLNRKKLKQCFYRHQKSAEKSWRNYAHELNSYFTEWIAELQHFLDDWIKLKTPYELAEKLDEYESIKQSSRREIHKKNSYKFQGGVNYSGARPKETTKDFKSKFQIKKEPVHEKNHEKDFEKRRQLRCYECGSYSHLRPQCEKLKKNYETVASNETVRNGTDVLAPYTSLGTVNGIEMPILRDTGATLDLICKKYVKPSMFINETVWIRTPLEETAVCLPMAEVELDCVFGHVIMKAAVLRDSLDQGKYLLGNKTAALFEEVKKNKEIQVYMVNAVETRSQKKLTEESKQDLNIDVEDFVKTRDKCQRVGKPQDKKKALLKIVPVITEIFTKINIDASGPLPMTPSGNKYIITALCMSSRYPDAIPVANLCSTTVVNALLQIFSQMGFPRELQTDQGTSFMSAQTTEFLERFGVRVVRSSVYHPQSNPVERMHRTLKKILRVLCLEAIPEIGRKFFLKPSLP
ncbi:retrovirus-related Pol polyprotein from transposon 17.6 [Trichonephila clavipes]|uniref:Retrovirus-related Pol polyprotein from transposon 17.6 n=1 Tax=Trichonephila clavipes TaxID=2585209 RepID=A0A8X7BHG0_TRICX|nr:retrovirus-related Pol polyprotein from transposon 17.6 [Trichonephila clavipes]